MEQQSLFLDHGNGGFAAARGETVFVWDAKTGAQRLMIPGQERLKTTSAVMAISRDGARLASGTPVGWAGNFVRFRYRQGLDFLPLANDSLEVG